MNNDDTIKSNLTWRSDVYFKYYASNVPWQCFPPVGESYVGVQFHKDSSVYYAWVRCSATDSSVTIKDYAYNTQPDMFILAGQTSLGIMQNLLAANTNIYIQNRVLNINFNSNVQLSGTVSLFNSMGHCLFNIPLNGNVFFKNLSQWPAGIYFVKINTDQVVINQKIILY